MGSLEVRTWDGAGVSVLVCTREAAYEMDWWQFWSVSVDTTILHTFFSAPACPACTDMVYSRRYNCRDVEGDTAAPENFGIYSFIEHDRFDFSTSEERIRAAMYIPCVKCSCSELKLEKHLHTFFVLT